LLLLLAAIAEVAVRTVVLPTSYCYLQVVHMFAGFVQIVVAFIMYLFCY